MPAISGKGDTFESDLLKLIFQAVAIANIADNAATSPLTNLFVALHSADPLEAGDQTSNELTTGAYAGYARVSVARTSGGWTVSGTAPTQVANAAIINFPACTGGTGVTATHFSIGVAASGASKILYGGPVTTPLAISNGITPSYAIGALVSTED
jgi:hypothetical protein